MILLDTSVWIDHFRKPDDETISFLESGQVLTHPFVIGEILLGNFKDRRLVRQALAGLESAIVATDEEVLNFIETEKLFGIGIGLVDVHVLASARLSAAKLLTRDRRLCEAAEQLGLA